MAKVVIAGLLNWFLPGLGYLIIGHTPLLAIGTILGMIGLTWVEQFSGLEQALPDAFKAMFASVLLINTMFAIDCYQEGRKKMGQGGAAAAQVNLRS